MSIEQLKAMSDHAVKVGTPLIGISNTDLQKLLAVVQAATKARTSKVLCRSGYYDVSQFDEVFAEFDAALKEVTG